ncbi:MAG TPA: ABC transporter ATP-binding protein [Allosphingosinicella sp.]|jgi:ATP-binding cassette subfamily B protein
MAGRARLFFLRPAELSVIVALGVAQAAVLVAWVLLIWQAVDSIEAMRGDMTAPLPWLGGLLFVALANAVLRSLEFSICERIGFLTVRRLRMHIYRHMLGMAPRQIQHRSRGSLLLRMTGDLTMLRTWISRGIGRGTIGGIVLTVGLAAIAFLSPLMAICAALVFAAGAAASLTLGRRLRRLTAVVRRRRSLLASNIDEQINSLAVVQLFGRAGGEYSRLSQQNDAMTLALVREARVRGRMRGVAAGTGWVAVVAVLAAGLYEVSEGYITLGMLIAAAAGVRHLAGPVRSLGFAHDYWRRASISRKKILEFMTSGSRPLSSPLHNRLKVRRGKIQFDDVHVPSALHGVSATAQPGERIAVTGPSGAGKSTLLGLIGRLVEPSGGEVLIDGTPLPSVTLESSQREVGMVSGDLPLMRGSVRRNVSYRRPSATEAELWQVLAACGLEDLVARLPEGLDTWITEGGKNFSTGERQRIALARAIMGYPRILLLDEPTTNLDAESIEIFHEVVTRYPGTVFLATHDPAEAALMDRVWRLENGRLVEQSAAPAGASGAREGLLIPSLG